MSLIRVLLAIFFPPRVRVYPHCVPAHPLRVGAGRHRRTGHPEQERITLFGGLFCIFADHEVFLCQRHFIQ